jgi:Protein of unknown function (DUF3429)
MNVSPVTLPALVSRVGLWGLVPLLVAFAVVVMSPQFAWQIFAMQGALAYGAVMLAFAGAVHFGLCVSGQLPWSKGILLGSVMPGIVAVVALLWGGPKGLGCLVIGFGGFWLYESRRLTTRLPIGYLSMRRNFSIAVCSLLVLTLLAADAEGLA